MRGVLEKRMADPRSGIFWPPRSPSGLHLQGLRLSGSALKPCAFGQDCPDKLNDDGAGGRGRTDTLSPELDFESSASANSATPAYGYL